ncbi:MAG: hypothetical protein IPM54_14470 [Polyangiaceae bacterium]|nr:hypothetical protein [Polyangiaceae bacterium]
MSIEPFFRDEPLLRDEPPDTRKDVVTHRPDDDLYAVDTPPTYAMGLAERLAALQPDGPSSSVEIMLQPEGLEAPFGLTTITLDDLHLDEPLEDFDAEAQFDRKTLPSAPYPPAILDDGAAGLSWDVLPPPLPTFADSSDIPIDPPSDAAPSEEPRSPISSSLWGKLQRFVTGISRPSQPAARIVGIVSKAFATHDLRARLDTRQRRARRSFIAYRAHRRCAASRSGSLCGIARRRFAGYDVWRRARRAGGCLYFDDEGSHSRSDTAHVRLRALASGKPRHLDARSG